MENIDLYNNESLLENTDSFEDDILDDFGEVITEDEDDDEIIEDSFEDIDNF